MTEPTPNPETEPDEVDTTTDTPDTEEGTPDTVSRAELDKVIQQRDKLKAKIRDLSKPSEPEKPAEPSEADKLREGMKRTAARAVLVGAGVTDKADQATLLEALKLDAVELDEDGEPDTEELESRLAELRRILGAPTGTAKRTPRVDTRDKGGRNVEPADPDKARYRRIMGAQ